VERVAFATQTPRFLCFVSFAPKEMKIYFFFATFLFATKRKLNTLPFAPKEIKILCLCVKRNTLLIN